MLGAIRRAFVGIGPIISLGKGATGRHQLFNYPEHRALHATYIRRSPHSPFQEDQWGQQDLRRRRRAY
jgi:hypothetical protein